MTIKWSFPFWQHSSILSNLLSKIHARQKNLNYNINSSAAIILRLSI